MNKKKSLFYRFVLKILKVFYKKRNFIGMENIPNGPSLLIGNHAQIHGPLSSQVYYNGYKYIWCIGQMTKLKEVPAYAYHDFWMYKPKYIRWFYKILSYIIAPICSYALSRSDVIPVYKDGRMRNTINTTIDKLNDGAHVIIFPEEHKLYNEIVNEFQTRFVDIARFYYKKYKVEISFVPMYNAASLKTIVFGKPIKYDSTLDIESQRKKICEYLKEEITRVAKELPKHKVVPYGNIKKKDYPYSK